MNFFRRKNAAPTPTDPAAPANPLSTSDPGGIGSVDADTPETNFQDAVFSLPSVENHTAIARPHTAQDVPAPSVGAPLTEPLDIAAPVRRRIWDIEAEQSTEEVPSCRLEEPAPPMAQHVPPEQVEAEDVAIARARIAQFAQAGLSPTPSPAPGARAKTRLLGFRSADLAEKDPFSKPPAPGNQAVPSFPVGWIVIVEGPGRGSCFTLTSGVSNIGRGEDQTICLDFGDGAISRSNHAAVAFDDETHAFFLGQGGKSNIVRLNGRPVLSTEDLADGDRIQIGETELQLVALCGEAFSWDAARQETKAQHATRV